MSLELYWLYGPVRSLSDGSSMCWPCCPCAAKKRMARPGSMMGRNCHRMRILSGNDSGHHKTRFDFWPAWESPVDSIRMALRGNDVMPGPSICQSVMLAGEASGFW